MAAWCRGGLRIYNLFILGPGKVWRTSRDKIGLQCLNVMITYLIQSVMN
jgi:hypothetical protein